MREEVPQPALLAEAALLFRVMELLRSRSCTRRTSSLVGGEKTKQGVEKTHRTKRAMAREVKLSSSAYQALFLIGKPNGTVESPKPGKVS